MFKEFNEITSSVITLLERCKSSVADYVYSNEFWALWNECRLTVTITGNTSNMRRCVQQAMYRRLR